MITTAVIAFREFLEAFLIVGVFIGISKRLCLHKEFEIGAAALVGVLLSVLLATGMYLFGAHARYILTEDSADLLESYLLIFSGAFLSYVVFSLHSLLHKGRGGILLLAHKKLAQGAFDATLFFTIVFLVLREGFEIALFTASVALFSAFAQNMIGLLMGFSASIAVGFVTSMAYIRLPLGKIYRYTEYMIILLGASLTQHGITLFFDKQFHVRLSDMMPLHLQSLPIEDSVGGHILQSFLGIDRDISVARLFIMMAYIAFVYLMFHYQRQRKHMIRQSA